MNKIGPRSIIQPSSIEIDNYLKEWENPTNEENKKYAPQERSLIKLFSICPLNKDLDDVLIKVCSVNDFYSTRIQKTFLVAKRINELDKEFDIDERLKKGDPSIVHKIATGHGIKTKKKKNDWNFYSFATKYCSHHNPTIYPIYDSYVAKMLLYFNKHDQKYKQSHSFTSKNLREYTTYKEIIKNFIEFYGLKKYTLKEIDKYLWLSGKYYFISNDKKNINQQIIIKVK